MASTSAVNIDEAGQDFGGDEYDESYDGYYEDDGAEMGDGAEGTDGTKGEHQIETVELASMVEKMSEKFGGSVFSCKACGYQSPRKWAVKRHLLMKHGPSENLICSYCQKIYKSMQALNQHACKNI